MAAPKAAKKKPIKKAKPGQSQESAAERRALFVDAFLSNGENALQAAISAGLSAKTAGSQGSRMLKNVEVLALINKRRTEIVAAVELSTEKTIREVRRLAYSDPRNIVHKDGKVKGLHELDDDIAAAVASFEIDAQGVIKYKFWDKNSALDKAAKVQGLYEKDNDQKNPPIVAITRRIIG